MKVGALNEALRYLNLVRDKKDAPDSEGGGHSPDGYQPFRKDQSPEQQRQQDQQSQGEKPFEAYVDDAKVQAALEAFGKDVHAQGAGLNASSTGKGPGLKVVLKDGSGAVIRQFTGEEFLRLREAAAKDSRGRGKILDKKF